jgi:hypothetical protein
LQIGKGLKEPGIFIPGSLVWRIKLMLKYLKVSKVRNNEGQQFSFWLYGWLMLWESIVIVLSFGLLDTGADQYVFDQCAKLREPIILFDEP